MLKTSWGNISVDSYKGKSTTDQIFTLQSILVCGREYQIQTHHLFLVFKSAFETTQCESLYQAMKDLIAVELILLIKLTISNVECMVCVQGDVLEGFTSKTGIRQGDALACWIFNSGLKKAIRESKIQISGMIFNQYRFGYNTIHILGYADNLDIIGTQLQ